MALPAPISIEVSRSRRNTRVPSHVPSVNTTATTTTAMAMPGQPTEAMSWKVTRRPYSTMPSRNNVLRAKSTPLAV